MKQLLSQSQNHTWTICYGDISHFFSYRDLEMLVAFSVSLACNLHFSKYCYFEYSWTHSKQSLVIYNWALVYFSTTISHCIAVLTSFDSNKCYNKCNKYYHSFRTDWSHSLRSCFNKGMLIKFVSISAEN